MHRFKLLSGLFLFILIQIAVFSILHRTPVRLELSIHHEARSADNQLLLHYSASDKPEKQHTLLGAPRYIADSEYSRVFFELPAREIDSLRIKLGSANGHYRLRYIKIYGRSSIEKRGDELEAAIQPDSDSNCSVNAAGILEVNSSTSAPTINFPPAWISEYNRMSQPSSFWRFILAAVLFALCYYLCTLLLKLWKNRSSINISAMGVLGLLSGFALVFTTYSFIELPFSNPWNIKGPITSLQYNPANNVLRFLYFILLPGIALFLFRAIALLVKGKQRGLACAESKLDGLLYIGPVAVACLFIILLGNKYTFHEEFKPVDSFHQGESLGPAIDYIHGLKPYEESLSVHGAFQDPLRSVIGFELFGRSISSFRTLRSLVQMLTTLLWAVACFELMRRNVYAFVAFFAFLMLIQSTGLLYMQYALPFRNVSMLLLLSLLPAFYAWVEDDMPVDEWKNRILCFLWGFLPLGTFAISIDRGFFLSMSVSVLLALVWFSKGRRFLPSLRYFAAGGLAGILLLGICIRGSYWAFFKFSFLIMPQYKELMDGLPYRFGSVTFYMPLIGLALALAWLAYRLHSNWRKSSGILANLRSFINEHVIEIFLILLAVTFFRSALGRSDKGHVIYSSFNTWLCIAYIVAVHFILPWIKRMNRYAPPCLSILAFAFSISAFFFYQSKIKWDQLFTLPIYQKDSRLTHFYHRELTDYLDANMDADDAFYTMTNEGFFYYLLDRPCPSRFNLSWIAMPPFYQEEIINDLEEKEVKWVLYRNKHWASKMDNITNEQRLPLLTDYLKENYEPHITLHDNEVWKRKETP